MARSLLWAGAMSSRKIAVLFALWVSCSGCVMEKVEDLADRYIPEANPKQPAERICEARATTRVQLSGNLSSLAQPVTTWDAQRPQDGASFRVDCTLYGDQANPVAVALYFAAQGGGIWNYHAMTSGEGAAHAELGHGQLHYDAEGALTSVQVLAPLRLPRANGTLGANVALWLGTPKSQSSDGLDGMVSMAGPSTTALLEQDGHAEYRDSICRDDMGD